MGLLVWIVVGLIAGWLTGQVIKGGGFGLAGDGLAGAIGALLGGFLADVSFGGSGPTDINVATTGAALLGAVVLIVILRLLPGRSRV